MSPSKHLTPVIFYICFRSLPNVPLADKDTGMVDTLSKAKLEDLCLQPPLQEIFNLQTQDIIELHLTLIQHTDSHQTSQQGVAWIQNSHLNFQIKQRVKKRDVRFASLTRNS